MFAYAAWQTQTLWPSKSQREKHARRHEREVWNESQRHPDLAKQLIALQIKIWEGGIHYGSDEYMSRLHAILNEAERRLNGGIDPPA
ncbi:MAG: hypothetical protein EXR53_00300 [Dehalococcoidia bacterium]|nr:hypothetical protein [Dehalococcoidia bacterium]